MSEELKPCPFCGSDEIMDMRYSGDARVQCAGCNASTDTHDSHIESHAAWNRRAQPAEVEGVEVAGYRWKTAIPEAAGGGYGWSYASHWSTGPKDAEKLMTIADHLTALSAVTAERDRLRSENDRLRSGVRGDFDLDAWLDWAKESDQLRAELQALRELVGQCVEYLNPGRKNSIASGSILHRALTAAVEGK